MNSRVSEKVDSLDTLNKDMEFAILKKDIAALSTASEACHHYIQHHFPIKVSLEGLQKKDFVAVLEQVASTHEKAKYFVHEHKKNLELELMKVKNDATNIRQYLEISKHF